jgi:hypothetical protein
MIQQGAKQGQKQGEEARKTRGRGRAWCIWQDRVVPSQHV